VQRLNGIFRRFPGAAFARRSILEDKQEFRMQEREHQRSRAFLGGRVVFNNEQSSFDCIVKDISEAGALLKTDSAMAAPDNFLLTLSDGRRFNCIVRWRKINSMGVEFAAG
jgi:hypothetical protein